MHLIPELTVMDFQPVLEKACGTFQANATKLPNKPGQDPFRKFKSFMSQFSAIFKGVKNSLLETIDGIFGNEDDSSRQGNDNLSGELAFLVLFSTYYFYFFPFSSFQVFGPGLSQVPGGPEYLNRTVMSWHYYCWVLHIKPGTDDIYDPVTKTLCDEILGI